MRKTLTQAIGAAFCAILCALSGMGGGGMMIGARTAAWAKSGYTAKDYVQDGLIAMWDGIENAGWGRHEEITLRNQLQWVNLVSGKKYSRTTTSTGESGVALEKDHYNVTGPAIFYQDEAFSDFAFFEVLHRPDAGLFDDETKSVATIAKFGRFLAPNAIAIARKSNGGFCYKNNGNVNVPCVLGETHLISQGNGIGYIDAVRSEVSETGYGQGINYSTNNTVLCVDGSYVPSSNKSEYIGKIWCIRAYNRNLTPEEVAANYAVDKARFGLPDVT